jgi:hypothetical protein
MFGMYSTPQIKFKNSHVSGKRVKKQSTFFKKDIAIMVINLYILYIEACFNETNTQCWMKILRKLTQTNTIKLGVQTRQTR